MIFLSRNKSNDASEPFKVRLSRFEDVKKGISIYEGMGHSIESSHFFNPPTGSNDPFGASIGIHLLGTNGVTINKANHFEGTGVHDYGIVSNETGAMPTLVQDNLFNNLRSGLQTEKDNHGEQIRCNQFAQHYRAWSINPVSPATNWFSDQGDCGQFLDQAGNKFSDDASNCANQNWKHHIQSSIAFEYRYRGGYAFEKPECSSAPNVALIDCSSNGGGVNSGSCASAPPPCDPCPLSSLEAAIEAEENPFEKQRLQIELIGAYLGEGQIEDGLTLLQTAFPNEKMLQINTLIEHGYFAEAQISMASINPSEIENWSDFQAFFKVLIDLGQNQTTVWQLSESQVASLSAIANSTSKARFSSQALLELRNGEHFQQPIEQWAEDFGGNSAENRDNETPFEPKRNAEALQLSPNPTNDQIKIRWQLPENESASQVEIFDLNGRLVGKKKLTATRSGEADWSFEHEPKGIYIVLIRYNNGVTVGRISVQ